MINIVAFFVGAIFALGLIMSGMVLPQKVLGFLDITGDWDPSLMAVMGGAILVHAPFYHWVIKKRKKPQLDQTFHLPSSVKIDYKLIMGSAIFGIGWGLAGICPGPGLVNAAGGVNSAFAFCAAMIVGMFAFQKIEDWSHQRIHV